jgi:hypothetical protein
LLRDGGSSRQHGSGGKKELSASATAQTDETHGMLFGEYGQQKSPPVGGLSGEM